MSFVNILSYLDVNMTIWNDIPIHIKMVMTTRYGSFILNINKKAVNHKRLKRYKASLFPTDRQIMQSDKNRLVTREDWKFASLYLIPEMLHHLVIDIMQFTFKSTQLLWIVTSFQYNVLLLYDNGMHCLIFKKEMFDRFCLKKITKHADLHAIIKYFCLWILNVTYFITINRWYF